MVPRTPREGRKERRFIDEPRKETGRKQGLYVPHEEGRKAVVYHTLRHKTGQK